MAFPQSLSIVADNLKARFEEPYVSAAINRMGSGLPRGIYRGFTVEEMDTPGAGVKISPASGRDSYALHEDLASGYKLAIRFDAAFDFEFEFDASAASLDLYLWLDATYQVSSTVTGYVRVGEIGDLGANSIPFAKVEIPLGATTILTSYVKQLDSLANTLEPVPSTTYKNPYGFMNQDAWDRLPNQDQKDAMDGASSPSSSNPFATISATEARVFAKKTTQVVSVTPPVASFQLLGTWYIGKGAVGTAKKWFELFCASGGEALEEGLRDYYTWKAIQIDGIYDSTNTSQLTPSSDADADGFYENPFIRLTDPFQVWAEVAVKAGAKSTFGSLDVQEYTKGVLGVREGMSAVTSQTIRDHCAATVVSSDDSDASVDFAGASALANAIQYLTSNNLSGTIYLKGAPGIATTGQYWLGTLSISTKIKIVCERPNIVVKRLGADAVPMIQLASSSAVLECDGLYISSTSGDVAIDSGTNGGTVILDGCDIAGPCTFGRLGVQDRTVLRRCNFDGAVTLRGIMVAVRNCVFNEDSTVTSGDLDMRQCHFASSGATTFQYAWGIVENVKFDGQVICDDVGRTLTDSNEWSMRLVFQTCSFIPYSVTGLTDEYCLVITGSIVNYAYVVFRDCDIDPTVNSGNEGGGVWIDEDAETGDILFEDCRIGQKDGAAYPSCLYVDTNLAEGIFLTLNRVSFVHRGTNYGVFIGQRGSGGGYGRLTVRDCKLKYDHPVNTNIGVSLFAIYQAGQKMLVDIHGLEIDMGEGEPNFIAGSNSLRGVFALDCTAGPQEHVLEDIVFKNVGYGRTFDHDDNNLLIVSDVSAEASVKIIRPAIVNYSSTVGGTVFGLTAIRLRNVEQRGQVDIVAANLSGPDPQVATESYKGVYITNSATYGSVNIIGGSIKNWQTNDVHCDAFCRLVIDGMHHVSTGSDRHKAGQLNARIRVDDILSLVVANCVYEDQMGASGADQRVWLGIDYLSDYPSGGPYGVSVTGNSVAMIGTSPNFGRAFWVNTMVVGFPDACVMSNSGQGRARYPGGGGTNRIVGLSGNNLTRSTTFNFNTWDLEEV